MASINPSGLAYSLAFLLAVILLNGFAKPVARNWKLITILLTLTFLTVRHDSVVWIGVIGIAVVPFLQVRNFLGRLLSQRGPRKQNSLRMIPLIVSSLVVVYISSRYVETFKELTGPKSDANSTGSRQHLSGFFTTREITVGYPNGYQTRSTLFLFDFDSDFNAHCAFVGSEPFRRAFLLTICSAFCLLFLGSALRPGYLQGRYFFPGFAFGVVCASYALNERFDQLSKQASARLFGLGATALSILHLVSFSK